jgi:diguanylate cyclase (GGDEF)-like protein
VRARVAARCRSLAPWLLAIALALLAIGLAAALLVGEPGLLRVVDLPTLLFFGLALLAVPATAAMLAYRAHVRERRQRSEVESLLAIMRDVHAAAGTEAAAGVLLEHTRSLVGATGAALVLHTADGRVLRAQVDGRERARRSISGEATLPERTLLEELALTSVMDLSPSHADRRTGLTALGLPAAIAVALRGDTRVVGLLAVERNEQFGPRERRLLETVGTHAGNALETGQTARALVAVTELKERLAHEARHDPLTGLANRSLFALRVEAALARDDNAPAVMFVDLDDFKGINDTLGHAAGDALLVTVAERLRASLREDDLAARLGGDEFAVLLEDVPSLDYARDVATRVLELLLLPIEMAGVTLAVPASVGVTLATADCTVESLLREADIAMYNAKSKGKGQVALFDESLRDIATQHLALKIELPEALRSGQFRLDYQPIVNTGDQTIRGFEALIRWHHPTRGVVAPGQFIAAAEASGIIVDIGRWVLEQACHQAVAWNEGSPRPLTMSVNVSATQLHNPGFIDVLRTALEDSGLPPELLTIELTESILVEHNRVAQILEEIRAVGVSIAIDDFGTGYSSLSYLQKFPVTSVKVDRTFVAELAARGDSGLVRSILSLAEALGLTTVAEGVETAGQLAALNALECDLAQGYFLGYPQNSADITELLRGDTLAGLAGRRTIETPAP